MRDAFSCWAYEHDGVSCCGCFLGGAWDYLEDTMGYVVLVPASCRGGSRAMSAVATHGPMRAGGARKEGFRDERSDPSRVNARLF